ncbi:MAG TPA: hypothetical protein VF820_03525 [Patescibacteria group bacterium]
MKRQKINRQNPLTTVTLFSKVLAACLFIAFPFAGFFIGMQYQQMSSIVQQQSLEQFGKSGIKGVVVALTCNGVSNAATTICTTNFYPGFVSIQKQGSLDYQIVQADGLGNFTIYVDPGTYIVSPLQKNTSLIAGSKREVIVKKGEVSSVTVEYTVK